MVFEMDSGGNKTAKPDFAGTLQRVKLEFDRFYNYDTERGTIVRDAMRALHFNKVGYYNPALIPKKVLDELDGRKKQLKEAGLQHKATIIDVARSPIVQYQKNLQDEFPVLSTLSKFNPVVIVGSAACVTTVPALGA